MIRKGGGGGASLLRQPQAAAQAAAKGAAATSLFKRLWGSACAIGRGTAGARAAAAAAPAAPAAATAPAPANAPPSSARGARPAAAADKAESLEASVPQAAENMLAEATCRGLLPVEVKPPRAPPPAAATATRRFYDVHYRSEVQGKIDALLNDPVTGPLYRSQTGKILLQGLSGVDEGGI